MSASIFLRPVSSNDLPLLRRIFEETRPDITDASHLSTEMKAQLIQAQFEAQHDHYVKNYPKADFGIIQYGNTAIGRIYLNQTKHEVHVLELSILSSYRSQGLGSTILQAVLSDAKLTQRTARIHVEKQSPAIKFYEKHGFRRIGEKPFHLEMEWEPLPSPGS